MKKRCCILKSVIFSTLGLAMILAYWLAGIPSIYIGYVAGSFFISLPFVYWITAPGWWRSREGRAFMMMLGSLAAVFLLIMTSSLFGAYALRDLVRTSIYTVMAVSAVRLAVLFFQLRIRAERGLARNPHQNLRSPRRAMTDIREDWITTVVGVALNPDKFAGNQCVDTTDHFGQFIFGVAWQTCVGGVTGANQLLDVAPDKYWQRIDYYHGFIPERYDVLVYAGDNLNEWGHTAVTESADWLGINVVQQDGFAYPWQFVDGNYYSAKPAHRARLAYSQAGTGPLLGVLRARPEMLVRGSASINPAGNTTTPQEDTLSAAEVNEIKAHIDARFDNIALPGEATVRNAGPLYGMATKVDRIDAALLPGVEGQRHAGVVYAALDALKNAPDANVDPTELARAVAAALPADIAKQFVDELATALGKA